MNPAFSGRDINKDNHTFSGTERIAYPAILAFDRSNRSNHPFRVRYPRDDPVTTIFEAVPNLVSDFNNGLDNDLNLKRASKNRILGD